MRALSLCTLRIFCCQTSIDHISTKSLYEKQERQLDALLSLINAEIGMDNIRMGDVIPATVVIKNHHRAASPSLS
jgi:hypothetical protein